MSASDWLKGTLQNEGQKTGISPKSGDKLEWGQKVGMADSLAPQGFQGATHTNHTVHTEKQPPRKRGKNTLPAAKGLTKISDITAGIVSALATGQALPVPTLPDNLMQTGWNGSRYCHAKSAAASRLNWSSAWSW